MSPSPPWPPQLSWPVLTPRYLSLPALDRATTLGLLKTIFWTHAFYTDRPSRIAVQKCLVSLCKTGEAETITPLVAAVRQEAQKQGIAPGSAFVLVEWCGLFIQNLAGTPLWEKLGNDILLATADSLEKCLQPTSRGTVGSSALVITRRGFRSLVLGENTDKVVSAAVASLATKGAQPTAKNAPLLGVIAGVCSRKAHAKPILEKLKSQYLTFYIREIVGSRAPLPKHLAGGLADFFSAFVSPEDLEKEVFPALEKGLLRAPEVVLNDLITPLVHSLPEEFDLSKALTGRFIKPLLSNIKSSNADIRTGAVTAFKELVSGSRDFGRLEEVADEVLGPLKSGKLASADHRILHSEMLIALPTTTGIASKIAAGLPALTNKEGNEHALAAETLALNASAIALFPSDAEVPKALIDAYVKGLAEKKLPVRRIWILRSGEVLYTFSQDADGTLPTSFVKFAEAIITPLLAIFSEVAANPTAAAQTGQVTGALVLCGVGSLLQRPELASLHASAKKAAIQKTSLTLDPKPSYLLNQRIYSKFAEDDLKWLSRALSAVAPALGGGSASVKTAWAQAFFFLVCSATASPNLLRQVTNTLSDLYIRSTANSEDVSVVTEAIISGLWHWVEATEAGDRESAAALAKSENSNLHLILRSICLTPKEYADRAGVDPVKSQLESQMCSLLVLAKVELIPKASWIELCLKVETDPGELAKKYEDRLVEEIVARTGFEEKVNSPKCLV